MPKPSENLLKSLGEILEDLTGPPGIDWLNYAVSTPHDESIHVVVVNDRIGRFDIRIGDRTLQLVPPAFRLQITGERPAVRYDTPAGFVVAVEKGAGVIIGSMNPEEGDEAMEALERLMLAHACEGIDITHPNYVKGLITTLESIS